MPTVLGNAHAIMSYPRCNFVPNYITQLVAIMLITPPLLFYLCEIQPYLLSQPGSYFMLLSYGLYLRFRAFAPTYSPLYFQSSERSPYFSEPLRFHSIYAPPMLLFASKFLHHLRSAATFAQTALLLLESSGILPPVIPDLML